MNWHVFFFYLFFFLPNKEHFNFHLQNKHPGIRLLIVNMKTSYPKKSENVRTHSSNYIESATSL